MRGTADVWAVVPVKDTTQAKQRLGHAVPAALRQRLALAMMEDVLAAVAAAPGLGGIAVVTIDPAAAVIATRYGARVLDDGARDGQTGAIGAAARLLAAEGRDAMLALPGDIPLVTPDEIVTVISAQDRMTDFVIAPAHDGRGSNAILCAPPGLVPLRFGDDSFLPHLAAARQAGIEPTIVRLPGIGLDIDHPRDLAAFLKIPSRTRARLVLQEAGVL
ncbi:MAG TPA: 2-phospho-L-lactate guanylyltransferase [Xanthobacteraceae bacterium]|nr:2-phospho-L-lactate guanylyltransferase [Xanthobacteraceae bacterium]